MSSITRVSGRLLRLDRFSSWFRYSSKAAVGEARQRIPHRRRGELGVESDKLHLLRLQPGHVVAEEEARAAEGEAHMGLDSASVGDLRLLLVAGAHAKGDLGVTPVCEGVETPDEIAVLREFGVKLLKGYLFAPPALEALPVSSDMEGISAAAPALAGNHVAQWMPKLSSAKE